MAIGFILESDTCLCVHVWFSAVFLSLLLCLGWVVVLIFPNISLSYSVIFFMAVCVCVKWLTACVCLWECFRHLCRHLCLSWSMCVCVGVLGESVCWWVYNKPCICLLRVHAWEMASCQIVSVCVFHSRGVCPYWGCKKECFMSAYINHFHCYRALLHWIPNPHRHIHTHTYSTIHICIITPRCRPLYSFPFFSHTKHRDTTCNCTL